MRHRIIRFTDTLRFISKAPFLAEHPSFVRRGIGGHGCPDFSSPDSSAGDVLGHTPSESEQSHAGKAAVRYSDRAV